MTKRRLALIFVLVVALAGMFFSSLNPLNRSARDYARDVAVASAATYVTLRGLNAFLSTAQEVEVGGSFVVQGTMQPLKWLEPVDDTVERISEVVFFVMVATGAVAVSLSPASALGCAMVVGAALLLLIASRDIAERIGWRVMAYGGFLGLAVPLAFLMSSLVADVMTGEVQARHAAVVAEISAQVEPRAQPGAPGGVVGWFTETKGEFDRYANMAGVLYERSDALIESLIALLAVYLFKVLLLPMAILGGSWGGLRAVVP